MRYCHECGSEIAKIDVFCPFCGITQIPAQGEEETSQDRTIAVSQEEMVDLIDKKYEAAEADSLSDKFDGENELEENEKDEQPQNITSENIASDTDSEIPAETILDAADKSRVETSSQSESGGSASVAPRLYRDEAKAEKVNAEAAEPDDVVEMSEEVSAGIENQESAQTDEETSSEDAEIDFSSTIPYTPENILVHSGKFKKREEKSEDEPAGSERSVASAIHIPEEPIELVDDGNTQFDSVRIMQDDESNAETLLKKSVGIPASIPQKYEENKPRVEARREEEKEARSYTTPNIGGPDTEGGKRGAKLKSLEEGTILNSRYEIIRKIGGGGMGAVYLAADKNLGGILRAVKEMVQSYIEETAQDKAISDFKRESMLLTSLDHSSIPTIYDYFYDERESRFYLVMKYISGGDLASRLRSAAEGRIEEESVTEWAIQIADVLDYLHSRQPPIVYRDLKPSNIMIDGNTGRVMLIDFGIARWINKEEKGVTAVGTMGYAPPELFSGNVEPRSDIYSLGSTMFHLLTGADPQSNPLLIFDFQKHPRPRQINPRLSDQMEKILMRAVEYNADNRFNTAAEMRNVLTEHLQNLRSGKISFGVAKTPTAVALADQYVFCGFCGQKIVATDLFCAFCGSKQPLAQQGVHSAEYVSPMVTAKLMVIGTNDLDLPTYNLEKDDNLLGRRDPLSNIFPEIDLSKFDPQTKVSRRHARIWREGGQFFIEDLKSSNGTVITRVIGDSFRLVPNQPHPLTNGEKVKVGDTTLRFVIG